jgi:hypothetical protein
MTTIQQKPIKLPANRERSIARAIAADDSCVSAGGLAEQLGMLPPLPRPAAPTATVHPQGLAALARLVQLARREQGLTPDRFALKLGLDLSELVAIETSCEVPEPRVLHLISTGLDVSYEKLQVLVGYRTARDQSLEHQAIRFAASSEPMDKLSKAEAQALHEFIRALHD